MNVEFRPAFEQFEVVNRATRYIGYLVRPATYNDDVYVLLVTGWSASSGQWARIGQDSISWDYLEEKMPALQDSEGDKEGWVLLLADMGIEVFN